ncbi:acetyltransferase [Colletotrichum falcatum]|nr:acetyltransferase [Colletotrichum falcatum]
MTAYKIDPCTLADAPALARNNMSAFWTNHSWYLLWPKDTKLEFLIEQTTKRIPNNLISNRATLRHQKAVDPETGALLGYARWVLPPGYEEAVEWADSQIADVSEEEKRELKKRSDAAWWKPISMDEIDDCIPEKNRFMAKRPYINLDYLAVHPENKGKGVATALVENGIRLAEKMGVDILLSAFDAGLGVYKRLGFKEIHRGYQDNTKYGGEGYWVTIMTYEVNKASS